MTPEILSASIKRPKSRIFKIIVAVLLLYGLLSLIHDADLCVKQVVAERIQRVATLGGAR
jgi:hypothetical protein